MQTVKRFVWQVVPVGTPLLKKKCNKCRNSELYYSSNKFRLNSQKKIIDVWLVYKCIECDNTCNIEILSRAKGESIEKDLYERFMKNDEKTALVYAFNKDFFNSNHTKLDYTHLEYNVLWENISLDSIIDLQEDIIHFEVKCSYELDIRLTSLIKKCLNISSNLIEKLAHEGIITTDSSVSFRKCKVKNGITVVIFREKLRKYFIDISKIGLV